MRRRGRRRVLAAGGARAGLRPVAPNRWRQVGPPRGRSVRAYLTLLVGAVLLPLVLLAILLTWRAATAERERTQQAVAAVTDAARTIIDRELLGLTETLQTLATSPLLDEADIAGFQRQAEEVARAVGYAVILREAGGRQVANTLIRWGDPLPTRSSLSEWDEEVIQTRRPLVSNHYVGLTGGTHSFAVIMPVAREGGPVRWLMHVSVPVSRLRDVLGAMRQDPDWRFTIVDRKGVVLARSQGQEEAQGRPSILLARVQLGLPVLAGRQQDREGRDTYFVGQRSELSGWYVFTSVRAEFVDGALRRSLLVAALAALALVGGALVTAQALGVRLAGAIRGLASAGAAVERGEPVARIPAGITEIDEVGAALATASERLQAEALERERAAERQRLVLHELNHRVKNILASVQALATLTARGAADVATYRDRMAERLRGLARTQSLLTEGADWRGALLGEVLRAELGMHEAHEAERAPASGGAVPPALRIRLDGPEVMLPAHHVLPFGMLVHELATNAAKYGALSAAGGRLSVTWTVMEAGPCPALSLAWEEAGGPPVRAPERRGFGTDMIERGLARQLSAEVKAEWRPEGLRFLLRMPLPPMGAEATGPQGPALGLG